MAEPKAKVSANNWLTLAIVGAVLWFAGVFSAAHTQAPLALGLAHSDYFAVELFLRLLTFVGYCVVAVAASGYLVTVMRRHAEFNRFSPFEKQSSKESSGKQMAIMAILMLTPIVLPPHKFVVFPNPTDSTRLSSSERLMLCEARVGFELTKLRRKQFQYAGRKIPNDMEEFQATADIKKIIVSMPNPNAPEVLEILGRCNKIRALLAGQEVPAKDDRNKDRAGSHVRAQDKDGKPALMRASETGDADEVYRLLQSGTEDLNAKDEYGNTALMMAARIGKSDIVAMLAGNGADVNAQDKNGRTALMLAAINGHLPVTDWLYRAAKADASIKDKDGKTADELKTQKYLFLPH